MVCVSLAMVLEAVIKSSRLTNLRRDGSSSPRPAGPIPAKVGTIVDDKAAVDVDGM